MFGNVRSQLSAEPNGGRAEIRLQRAEYLLFGLGLASAACAIVLLTAIVAMGQRHPSVYKSGIINAFNPPAFAAAAGRVSESRFCENGLFNRLFHKNTKH